jgi:periplasmic copper chaperone A
MLNRRQVVMGALLAAGTGVRPAPADAQDYWLNQVRVSKPWAPPTRNDARSGEVYMLIENRGPDLNRLVAVETPVAERVSFVDEDRGTLEMVAYIDLRARREIALRPGRVHLRLDGLKQPLAKGGTFPLTLVFANRQKLEVRVDVDDRG